uniref:NADH-ubiquinone oxidoreductase chain 2 n=1 Tax=Anthribidae sp. 2 ACP-2013 TaxID=1434429 RepID=A0A3G3MEG6_9CUCU|nr:NADH dehydrogenase subunit 2 [Anthribidae sp. 2 ACP-2013]
MLKFYKILFFNTMIFSIMTAISSHSWIYMWLSLEINLISIIPLMISDMNMYNSEAIMKYFSSQSMASMLFIFSILSLMNNFMFIKMFNLILSSSLLMKMGAAPFHFWFPQVMEGLNWNMNLLMLTSQKIIPFIMLSYNMNNQILFFYFIVISNSLIGSLLGLNQISLRKILTYSSINHMSWMIMSMKISLNLWMTYFLIYSLISINIIMYFKIFNIFYIKQMILKLNKNKMTKMFLAANFFSLGGLPPFLGFLPKWFTMNELINQNFWLINLIMIMGSLITLYYYLRIIFTSLIINHSEIIFFKNNKFQFWLLTFNFVNLSSLILTLIFFTMK